MTGTATDTRPIADFQVREVAPLANQQLATVAKAPPPPKESRVYLAWKRFAASPHGRAIYKCTRGIPVVAPIVITGAAGYMVGDYHAFKASAWFGLALGAAAGVFGAFAQTNGKKALIATYERAKASMPRLASFLNVTIYMTLPATVAGMAASHYLGGGWGVAAAVAGGLAGACLGNTAHEERLKDHPPR